MAISNKYVSKLI